PHSLLRLADGRVLAFGENGAGQCNVPALPPGLTWVQIAAGRRHSLGRRSDGALVAWGDNVHGQCNIPASPPGLAWVGIASGPGADHSIGRRSDGSVVAWGRNGARQCDLGVLPPGLAALQASASAWATVVRYGPPAAYVRTGLGCAGSMPAAALVPLDLPRIGTVLTVALDHLPADVALMFTGLSATASRFGPLPLSLAGLGMPGCTAYTSDDAVTFVIGSGNRARYELSIPAGSALVGLRLHQQALVLDPGAGNALGAAISDAAALVVGR
ncbi:MAG: hypothetical protein FJ265_09865, partial [Planctomycetes bacterium]|nr:hypothetical protein [Planctomycetota bacterium]